MKITEKLSELKSNKSLLGGILVVIIIVVLVLTVGKGSKKEEVLETENTDTKDQTALSVGEPVVSGDYEYAFSGVEWIFDTEDPLVIGTGQTYLKMIFADFTRNGNAITFGRPYKLGFHPGTCESVEFLDTTDVSGIPLAYAKCSDGKITREFAVLQEAEKVTVKMNEIIGEEETGFEDWYKINVTEIVK
ncbi:MAG: hypothetical protein QG654_182 [Patescibacteria group bacterium]|jgi:hypothetical protein|nr:hypothetical protein [Patescibacteria group bacterium]